MLSQSEAIALTQKYIADVKASGINVVHAYIFGSYSRNSQHKWSDVDVAVISPNFGADPTDERVTLMMISNKSAEDVEPHPISLEDFEAGFDPFVKEVKMGIKIV